MQKTTTKTRPYYKRDTMAINRNGYLTLLGTNTLKTGQTIKVLQTHRNGTWTVQLRG